MTAFDRVWRRPGRQAPPSRRPCCRGGWPHAAHAAGWSAGSMTVKCRPGPRASSEVAVTSARLGWCRRSRGRFDASRAGSTAWGRSPSRSTAACSAAVLVGAAYRQPGREAAQRGRQDVELACQVDTSPRGWAAEMSKMGQGRCPEAGSGAGRGAASGRSCRNRPSEVSTNGACTATPASRSIVAVHALLVLNRWNDSRAA